MVDEDENIVSSVGHTIEPGPVKQSRKNMDT